MPSRQWPEELRAAMYKDVIAFLAIFTFYALMTARPEWDRWFHQQRPILLPILAVVVVVRLFYVVRRTP